MERLGAAAAANIDWTAPRLVCIAADFTKYDGHAVQQINRNIELIRYRRFGVELLLLELANATSASSSWASSSRVTKSDSTSVSPARGTGPDKSIAELLPTLTAQLTELLSSLDDYVLSLGDDVQRKELKLYIAFKRLKNFATVVLQKNRLLLFLHLDPKSVALPPTISRDVTDQGHWGTGDLEIALTTIADLDVAKPFIVMAYEGRAGLRVAS